MRAFELIESWPVDNAAAAVINRHGEIHYHGDESREFHLGDGGKAKLA
ncbi:MAG: hypothetical protein ACKO97_08315 [Actinomycetota bacterium]